VRYYEPDMVIKIGDMTITWNQVIAVGLFFAGAIIYLVQSKRAAITQTAPASPHISE
jgi:hypothetical protein